MSQLGFTPGQAYGLPRIGWSAAAPGIGFASYGTLESGSPATFLGAPVVEIFYDTDAGALNVTVGASAQTFSPQFVISENAEGAINGVGWGSGYAAFDYDTNGSGHEYAPGQVTFSYDGGETVTFYECIQTSTGNAPGSSPDYFVPLAAPESRAGDNGLAILSPPLYSASVEYFAGSIVADSSNNIYTCFLTSTGNAPASSPTYFGLLTSINSVSVAEPVPPSYEQLYAAGISAPLGNGSWTELRYWYSVFGASAYAVSPEGATMSAATELGGGYVRYSWPVVANPFTPTAPDLFTGDAEWFVNII